ncbi:MAG: inositol monophosphatase [Planctomycetota bacterium]
MRSIPEFFHDLGPSIQLAARAAVAAGEVIRDGYERVHEIDQKGVGDLVSRVDFEADREASRILSEDPDQLPILSEELSPETDDPTQDMWIVDPLDGTTAYLMSAGRQFSSVLIARRQQNETSLAITYFPLLDEWFYAVQGRGAWKNGDALKMNFQRVTLSDAWIEMNQYGDANFETSFFANARARLRAPGAARIVTSTFPHAGVAMRIAEQSSGLTMAIHDNNPDSLKQGPWDIAANQLIFEEAGGLCLNPDGERTSPFVAEPIIIAPTQSLADELLKVCQTLRRV